MFYCVLGVAVPHNFLLRCKNWKDQLCLCVYFSVTLSFSGIKVTPSSLCSLPHISLLPCTAPHISLAWLLCKIWKGLASIMHRNLSPWPNHDHYHVIMWHLHDQETILKHFCHWYEYKKNHCCKSNYIWWANQRSNCVSNCKHVECITSAIIMHLLAASASDQAQNRLGSCVARCMFMQNVQQCKKVHEQCQSFFGSPDTHLCLIHVED